MKTIHTIEGTRQNIAASAVDCAPAQSTLSLSLSLSLSVSTAAYRSTRSVCSQTAAFVLDG